MKKKAQNCVENYFLQMFRKKLSWKFIFLQAKPTNWWSSIIWFQSWPLQPRHEALAKWIPSGRKSRVLLPTQPLNRTRDSPPSMPNLTHEVSSAGILEQSMGARRRVGIRLSYGLVESIPWNQFLGFLKVYKSRLSFQTYQFCLASTAWPANLASSPVCPTDVASSRIHERTISLRFLKQKVSSDSAQLGR